MAYHDDRFLYFLTISKTARIAATRIAKKAVAATGHTYIGIEETFSPGVEFSVGVAVAAVTSVLALTICKGTKLKFITDSNGVFTIAVTPAILSSVVETTHLSRHWSCC